MLSIKSWGLHNRDRGVYNSNRGVTDQETLSRDGFLHRELGKERKVWKERIERIERKGRGGAWKALTASALALLIGLAQPVLALGSPLDEVRDLLETGYVDSVDPAVLHASSVDEMLEKLGDPYTVYFTKDEYQAFLNSMDMTFSGIGVYIELVPEGVRITSVMPGSPAAEVGLKSGDVVIKAQGQYLAGLSQETATGLLRGPEGSMVEIKILRIKGWTLGLLI